MALTSCDNALSLFTVNCMDNLVINVQPVIATDNDGTKTNCFTEKYPALTLTDLFVSAQGKDNDGDKCVAYTSDTAQDPNSPSHGDFIYGNAQLTTKVETDGFYFNAANCGTTHDADQSDDVDDFVQFKAYLMSTFNSDVGAVLVHTEMLETEILCKYSEAVDGIQVAIDTDLDNVEDIKKVTNDEEEKEIAAGEVQTEVKVNGNDYNPNDSTEAAITLGSKVQIAFTSIGELIGGYYIESCTADNKVAAQIEDGSGTMINNNDYKSVDLITSGCKDTTDTNSGSINPQIVDANGDVQTGGGTILEFNQFAFVTSDSTFEDPDLDFQLNCVLKFGNTPTCESNVCPAGCGIDPASDPCPEGCIVPSPRRRRSSSYLGSGKESVSISLDVRAGKAYAVNDGVALPRAEDAESDSGATEMLVSAYAAAAFLLL